MKCLLIIPLVFTLFPAIIKCKTTYLTIGGLFHEENTETEMAFKYAIARHNMYNNDVKFRTNIQYVPKDDVFTTGKTVCNMTSSGDGLVAIFGPQTVSTGAMAQSVCSNLEIPHIQIGWSPEVPYGRQTLLNAYPDHDLLATGMATLVKHMDWKTYAIVYETNEGLMRLNEILKLALVNDDPIMIRQLGSDHDYRPLLKQIRNSTVSQIILDCSTENVLNVLQQAKEVMLLEYFYSYLITSLDTHTLDFSVLETKANITVVRIVDPDNHLLNNAVLDWIQGESNSNNYISISPAQVTAESALMHDAVNFFTSILPELHITEEIIPEPLSCDEDKTWSAGFRISNYLKIRNMLNAITGPVKFDENGRRIDFTLQIVEINNGRAEKTGFWSPLYPDTINFTRSVHEQMKQIVENLQKTEIVVSSRLGPPYLRERKAQDGEILAGNSRYEGYSMDLIYELSKQLNFTFRFELAEDGKYGNYDEKTKNWNGLIKDLLDRKAHLAICDLTMTHARRAVVDFSSPFMSLGVSILYRKAEKADANKFAFMDPFGLEVWVYTGTLFLGLSIALYFIARMAPGDWESSHPCDETPSEYENIWGLRNCFWITLGSIMTQGCDILPKGISTRMGVSMWWFFSLIMTSSYTANLAAFLTMDRLAPSIDNAEELAKQTKIKYGTVEGGATMSFFKDSNFSTYARMWTQMQSARPTVFEKNNADGVKRVLSTKNQGYAFLMESSSIEYEVQKNCQLKQVGGRLDSKTYGIAMPMNAPYRSAISKAILKLQEDGKLSELKARWWKEKVPVEVPCEEESGGSSAELRMTNVGGIFITLGIGVAGAFVMAIAEFLWNVRQISIEQHTTYSEALIAELKFAVKVWITKKRAKSDASENSSASEKDQEESSSNKLVSRSNKGSLAANSEHSVVRE